MADPKLHRIGDANSGGGIIDTVSQDWVTDEGKLVSINGSLGTGHGPGIHAFHAWQTAIGSSFVTINDIPVNIEGNPDTCLHSRVAGSSLTTISE
tara:strand:- start:117 stop:401 length:285 start_codon:yes stop_codon:yes gene_type:complete